MNQQQLQAQLLPLAQPASHLQCQLPASQTDNKPSSMQRQYQLPSTQKLANKAKKWKFSYILLLFFTALVSTKCKVEAKTRHPRASPPPRAPPPPPTVVVTFRNLSFFPARLFQDDGTSCVSLFLNSPIFGKGGVSQEINTFPGHTLFWILIGSYEMLGTDEVIVSHKRVYELPSDTKRIGSSIERWLHRIHTDLLHRPNVQSVEDLANDEESYGPAAVYCLVTNEGGGVEHVYSHFFNDFPKSDSVAVPIRSISKLVTAVTVLRLGDLATREEEDDDENKNILGYLSKETRTTLSNILNTKLSDLFPSCETSTLGSATVSEMLTMQTALDNRLNALWKFIREMPDHAAFPPYCDVKGLSPEECVELVICPAYPLQQQSLSTDDIVTTLENSLPEELATAASSVRLPICEDENENCSGWAATGECENNPVYMLYKCRLSCNTCISPSYPTSSCITGDRESCRAEEFNKNGNSNTTNVNNNNYFRRGWFLYQSGDKNNDDSPHIQYQLNFNLCNYDNYSYTLIDAMISRLTNRPVYEWALEIVAETIGMTDMIRCIKIGGKDCYGHSRSLEDTLNPQTWPEWTGGVESINWSGSTYIASARDLASLGAVLLNHGKMMGDDDSPFLSESSIHKLMEVGPHWNVDTEITSWTCQGLDAFGYGLGYCPKPRAIPQKQRCSAARWYGWGSTYGSRFMFMPIANGGISCATNFNQATKESDIMKDRVGARQHTYSHKQAEQIRMLFPE